MWYINNSKKREKKRTPAVAHPLFSFCFFRNQLHLSVDLLLGERSETEVGLDDAELGEESLLEVRFLILIHTARLTAALSLLEVWRY
jgi:hypothetical protein